MTLQVAFLQLALSRYRADSTLDPNNSPLDDILLTKTICMVIDKLLELSYLVVSEERRMKTRKSADVDIKPLEVIGQNRHAAFLPMGACDAHVLATASVLLQLRWRTPFERN